MFLFRFDVYNHLLMYCSSFVFHLIRHPSCEGAVLPLSAEGRHSVFIFSIFSHLIHSEFKSLSSLTKVSVHSVFIHFLSSHQKPNHGFWSLNWWSSFVSFSWNVSYFNPSVCESCLLKDQICRPFTLQYTHTSCDCGSASQTEWKLLITLFSYDLCHSVKYYQD